MGDIDDLSRFSHPLGVLCPHEAPATTFRLTQAQIDDYNANGFLVLDTPVFTDEQCDMLLRDYNHLLEPEKYPHPGFPSLLHEFHANQGGNPDAVLMHCLGQWRLTAAFHDVIFARGVVVPTSQLLRPGQETAVRFWHDQCFAKPAKHGGVVAWHQDYSYWQRTIPMCHMTVHVALDAQNEENGGLHFVPGSHRWQRDGKPLPITDRDFATMESIRSILTADELDEFTPVCGNIGRGCLSFHHPLTVHGSFANRSAAPRRALALNYFADGTISDTDGELLQNVPPVPRGHKIEGQFFPLVFDPAVGYEGE